VFPTFAFQSPSKVETWKHNRPRSEPSARSKATASKPSTVKSRLVRALMPWIDGPRLAAAMKFARKRGCGGKTAAAPVIIAKLDRLAAHWGPKSKIFPSGGAKICLREERSLPRVEHEFDSNRGLMSQSYAWPPNRLNSASGCSANYRLRCDTSRTQLLNHPLTIANHDTFRMCDEA
jgi:hypothetical protein